MLPSFRLRLDLPTRIYSDSAYTSTSYNPTLVHWSYTILKSSHDDLVYSVKAYKDWETNLREARDASKVRKDLTSQTILNRSAPSHGRCIPPSFKVTSCYILSTWLTWLTWLDHPSTLFSRSLGLEVHHLESQVPNVPNVPIESQYFQLNHARLSLFESFRVSWAASNPYTTWIQPSGTRCKKPSEIGCHEPNIDLEVKSNRHMQEIVRDCKSMIAYGGIAC